MKIEIEKLLKRKKLSPFLQTAMAGDSSYKLKKLQKKAGVSTATVTRFARELNFEGFHGFKNHPKEEIREKRLL